VTVYVLYYLRQHPDDGRWASLFVGVYSSVKAVEAAKDRLRRRPGFRDFPEGFQFNAYSIDEDYDDPMWFTDWPPGRLDSPPPPQLPTPPPDR
jgi:hypothetical protein